MDKILLQFLDTLLETDLLKNPQIIWICCS